MDKSGIAWRLPPPGARIYHGVLEANSALPGVRIEYSTDGGQRWLRYDDKLRPRVGSESWVRSASYQGERYSRVEKVLAPLAMD